MRDDSHGVSAEAVSAAETAVPTYLFVNENLGGHRTVHANLQRVFAQREDLRVDFVHAAPPGLLGRILRAPIPGLARLDLDLQPLRSALVHSAGLRRQVRERLASGDYRAVHLYTQNAMLGASSVLRGRPLVISTDSTWRLNSSRLPYRRPTVFTGPMSRIGAWFERRVLRRAHTIFGNTGAVVEALRATDLRLPSTPIEHMEMGVWSPYLREEPATRDPARRPTIVFLGISLERKGGNVLLDLWRERFSERADLLLVTKDTVEPAPGLRVVGDLEPGDRRLWDLLAESDIMCFPSVIDQAPNAVLEGASAGLPVIGHRGGAVPDMILDGVSGVVIDCHRPEEIAEALDALIADPELRARMGAAGSRHVRENYNIWTSADRLVDALEAAAGATGTARARARSSAPTTSTTAPRDRARGTSGSTSTTETKASATVP